MLGKIGAQPTPIKKIAIALNSIDSGTANNPSPNIKKISPILMSVLDFNFITKKPADNRPNVIPI